MIHEALPRKRAALAALTLAAACGAPPPPRPEMAPAAAAVAAVAPAKPRTLPLIAARKTGIYEITADGLDVRRLSATPAQQPRWQVPGQRLVFLTRDAAEVRSLDLPTGEERLVARVRTQLDCPSQLESIDGPEPKVELAIQDDDDFVVLPGRACLRLMDRNANMADYILDVRIDLATGRTEDYLPFARAACPLPRSEAPPCEPPARPAPPEMPAIAHAGPAGFAAISTSPSGRWVLLRGNHAESDYLWDQLVLYEPATRRTFPLVGEDDASISPWPAPLTAEQLRLEPVDLALLVRYTAAETPVYWLPGPPDRLVFGEHLVVAGVRIAPVGQLAPPP